MAIPSTDSTTVVSGSRSENREILTGFVGKLPSYYVAGWTGSINNMKGMQMLATKARHEILGSHSVNDTMDRPRIWSTDVHTTTCVGPATGSTAPGKDVAQRNAAGYLSSNLRSAKSRACQQLLASAVIATVTGGLIGILELATAQAAFFFVAGSVVAHAIAVHEVLAMEARPSEPKKHIRASRQKIWNGRNDGRKDQ